MDPRQFHDSLGKLIDSLCEKRTLDALRVLLPHYPLLNGLTDEWAGVALALKTVRMQYGSAVSPDDMNLVVALQHAAESALDRRQ
jgi:hypothetical protein